LKKHDGIKHTRITHCWYHRGTLAVKNYSHAIVLAPLLNELHNSAPDSKLKERAVPTQPLLRFTASDTHSSIAHNGLRACPPPTLLHGTYYQRLDLQTSAHKERPSARRPAEFVACNRQQIRAQVQHVYGNLACSLASVNVHESANLMRGIAYFTNGLHDARFILSEHNGDQACVGCQRSRECFHVNQTVGQHAHNSYRVACRLHELSNILWDDVMLNCSCDNVTSRVAAATGELQACS
jgi:hypothetical protein